jgi:hypothetical protein
MASAPNTSLECLGPVGRAPPIDYSKEIAEIICDRIACGETLSAICAEEDMPDRATVWRWRISRPEFEQQYVRAREAQVEFEADEILDIADDSGGDAYVDSEGKARIDGEAVQRAKLRIETRRWRAERLNRRTYGNSVQHKHDVEVRPAAGAAELPPGIAWIESKLSGSEEGPEPDPGGMGEG